MAVWRLESPDSEKWALIAAEFYCSWFFVGMAGSAGYLGSVGEKANDDECRRVCV